MVPSGSSASNSHSAMQQIVSVPRRSRWLRWLHWIASGLLRCRDICILASVSLVPWLPSAVCRVVFSECYWLLLLVWLCVKMWLCCTAVFCCVCDGTMLVVWSIDFVNQIFIYCLANLIRFSNSIGLAKCYSIRLA